MAGVRLGNASTSEDACEDEGLSSVGLLAAAAGFVAALFAELGLLLATFFNEELAAEAVTGLPAATVEAVAAWLALVLFGLLEDRAVTEPVFFADDDLDDAFEDDSDATVGVAATGATACLAETAADAGVAAGGSGLVVGAAAAAAAEVDGDPLEDDVADFLVPVADAIGCCCAAAAHCGLSDRCHAFGSGDADVVGSTLAPLPPGAGAACVETAAGNDRGCVVGVALLLWLPASPLFWRDCGCCDAGLLDDTLAAMAAAQVETGGATSVAGGAGAAGGGFCCEYVCGLVLRLPVAVPPPLLLLAVGTSCGMRNCKMFLSSRDGRGICEGLTSSSGDERTEVGDSDEAAAAESAVVSVRVAVAVVVAAVGLVAAAVAWLLPRSVGGSRAIMAAGADGWLRSLRGLLCSLCAID